MPNRNEKMIVGSAEWCELPELRIPAIKVRVDSGAKTSAIHAANVQPFKREGENWVSFDVFPLQNNRRTTVRCEARVIDRRVIKSSTGTSQKRYVIRTSVSIGGSSWNIELTLADRDTMGFRMLLGREAMQGRMLVDPSATCCMRELKKADAEALYTDVSRPLKGLRIGLLASNPNLYSNRRIIEAGEERGHQIQFYNIRDCYMKLDAKMPEIHYRSGTILNDLDAVIPRIKPSITFYGCALTRQFESMGVYSLNSSAAISQSRDKLYSLQLLLKSGLNIPTTGFANSPIDTCDLIDMVGWKVLRAAVWCWRKQKRRQKVLLMHLSRCVPICSCRSS
ncbi:RimK/LysX family protein [Verrucomicrobiota bacterium]